MPTYLPFDPNPRRPSKPPPPRTVDSQFHVLGPLDKYPIRPGAAYQMPSATWEAALRMHRGAFLAGGLTHGVGFGALVGSLAASGLRSGELP